MTILIVGMALFVGIHLLPLFSGLRQSLKDRLGENPYKLGFSLISGIGLILIIVGKGQAEFVHVYLPPPWIRHAAPIFMVLAFYCLINVGMPSNFKRFSTNPMLWSILLWSGTHLLANGDLSSIILFGSLAAFSLFEMIVTRRRGVRKSQKVYPIIEDIKGFALAIVITGLVMYVHPYLFGVAVLSF